MNRGLRVWLVVVVVATALVVTATAQELVTKLEAEFLERFTRFIEWPASSSVSDPASPFVIGVVNHPQILDSLNQMAATTSFKGKRLEVRRIESVNQALSCNVVFVGPGDRDRFREIVAGVAGRPVLVVSDSSGYGRQGSMINFLTEGEFVRFEVNRNAAEANGLRFAPELLALGEAVD
jgi:hypothetical protein